LSRVWKANVFLRNIIVNGGTITKGALKGIENEGVD
jgi:hypothetical protein